MGRRFNIRVYGIFLDDDNRILLADEYEHGTKFTKFPGGGLEFGEGTIDCIKRECMEELNQEIKIKSHFYTTDFFQESAFNSNDQLISIYYLIAILKPYNFKIVKEKFDFIEQKEGAQAFRLVPLNLVDSEELTFPVDKKVLLMLKNKFSG